MKTKISLAIVAITVLALGLSACVPASNIVKAPAKSAKPSARLTVLPLEQPQMGKTINAKAKFNHLKDHYTLLNEDLKEVVSNRIHLLVIDPSLTDYHHIHPAPIDPSGLFTFQFMPRFSTGYRAWANITPVETGLKEMVRADIGKPGISVINRTESREATADGYRFALNFDKELTMGEEYKGTLTVTSLSGSVAALESQMGVYGHIDGFFADYRSALTSQLTKANKSDDSVLAFTVAPEKSGYLKLFAQVKIGGRMVTAPFGVMVAEAKKK
jgi:hypothetical protein